jgi:quercetin dioxygenase-like cupin family protein
MRKVMTMTRGTIGTGTMNAHRSRTLILSVVVALLLIGSVVSYAAIVVFRYNATSDHIGLQNGPALVTARVLNTPVGEITGGWHYHPGYVYNVVTQGTITIEDGCGAIRQYSAGEAFETSEGRVHRAYNLGSEDAIEYNMFVGPPGRPIGVTFRTTSTGAVPPARSPNAATAVGDRSTILPRSPSRARASRTSTTGSGSRCSFQRTRSRETATSHRARV